MATVPKVGARVRFKIAVGIPDGTGEFPILPGSTARIEAGTVGEVVAHVAAEESGVGDYERDSLVIAIPNPPYLPRNWSHPIQGETLKGVKAMLQPEEHEGRPAHEPLPQTHVHHLAWHEVLEVID